MKLLVKFANRKYKTKRKNSLTFLTSIMLHFVKGVDVEIVERFYFYVMAVIWDIIWIVWYPHWLEFLVEDGIVQLVKPLALSVTISLKDQGKSL